MTFDLLGSQYVPTGCGSVSIWLSVLIGWIVWVPPISLFSTVVAHADLKHTLLRHCVGVAAGLRIDINTHANTQEKSNHLIVRPDSNSPEKLFPAWHLGVSKLETVSPED